MLHRGRRGAVIADAAVFDAGWVPADFHSREAALDAMAAGLEPLVGGEPAAGLFVHGPPGTGKTSASRYLLEKLAGHVPELTTATVNCWSDHSRYRVLYRIVEAVEGPAIAGQERSAAALRDVLEAVSRPVVVLLDEADQLAEVEVLYELLETDGLAIVLTANERSAVLADLDERLQSRLRTVREVAFDPYTPAQLEPILAQRARHGLHADAVTSGQLAEIARTAGGDARDAIAALEGAARRAEKAGVERIDDEHLAAAIDGASRAVRRDRVEALPAHQRAVYEVLTERGPASPGTIFEAYTDRVDKPRSKRTVRKYLRKLERYDLLAAEGAAQRRRYRLAPGAPTPE